MFIYSLEFHTGEKKMSQLATQGFINVKKILKGSLDSIGSPLPSVKIQIMCRKGVKAKHYWMSSTNF